MSDEQKTTDATLHETMSPREDLDHAGLAVQLAHEVDETKYKPFTLSMFRLYGVLLVAYLCGCLNGYDGSLMGGLNAMSTYQNYFHMLVFVIKYTRHI
jgi:hypothetical protein